MAGPVYALNLFNVADRDEYLAYSRRSVKEVQAHGGRVVALGKFREAAAGDIKPRTVMILVEWASKAAFDGYCNDPKIADLHPHREKGAGDYIWHLFDKLEDLPVNTEVAGDPREFTPVLAASGKDLVLWGAQDRLPTPPRAVPVRRGRERLGALHWLGPSATKPLL